jgi:O-methyltransferase
MSYKEEFVNQIIDFYKESIQNLKKVRLSKNHLDITHQVIVPSASYSPWYDDNQFLTLYDLIKGNTLVDIYRCYELYSFITKNKDLQGDILEVGVWKGGTGTLLTKALNSVSSSNSTYLVDTFKGVVKAGAKDTIYKGGEHADTSEKTVLELLNSCMAEKYKLLKGIYPDEVALPDTVKQLRLCHIDVDTYESGKQIINSVWPLISPGGAVIFDDYGFWGCEGITHLCNNLNLSNSTFIHNLNGHAIFIKHHE